MTTIKVKMSKERFVDQFMEDMMLKKQREYEARTAIYEYIKDSATRRIRKYHRKHPSGRVK